MIEETIQEPTEEVLPESFEDNPEENISQPTMTSDFLSPAAIVMIAVALITDIIGFIIFPLIFLGISDFGIVSMTGTIIVGFLMFIHSGTIMAGKGSGELTKKILKRMGLAALIKILPFIGSFPYLTIVTVQYLRHK